MTTGLGDHDLYVLALQRLNKFLICPGIGHKGVHLVQWGKQDCGDTVHFCMVSDDDDCAPDLQDGAVS